jgi:uncharacterized sulfatase
MARISIACIAVIVGCAGLSAQETKPPTRRPDIVLFLADDMTWLDCGVYGSKTVRTPNLDRLARSGMRFDRMFTATAMCSPTRQQLYTGLFPVRNGAFPNHSKVKPGTRSMVHYLRDLGYRVALAGKQHIGPKDSFPFEHFGAGRRQRGAKQLGLPVGEMAEFLARDRRQPCCLVVASSEPHAPWNRGDASAYPPAGLDVPPYLCDTPETRAALSKYYAEITFMDRQVGKCLELIDQHGDPAQTLVLWTSEQGSQLPFAKWTCYELGLHTGFIVRWPGRVEPGTSTAAMTQYVDVVPTLLEAVGGRVPAGLDGRSFLAVLEGRQGRHRDHVFGVHTTRGIIQGSRCYPIRSIRGERFKYIENLNAAEEPFSNIIAGADHGSDVVLSWRRQGGAAAARARAYRIRPPVELYDLEADPYERHNLAGRPGHRQRIERLRGLLHAWMEQQGDAGKATEMQAAPHRRR